MRRHYSRVNTLGVFAVLSPLYAMAGLLLFWSLFDTSPVSTLNADPKLVNVGPIMAGGTLKIRWDFTVHRPCEGVFHRRILDTTVRVLREHKLHVTAIGRRVITVDVKLPTDLPPGDYEYLAYAVYECNPVRSIIQERPTVPFTVVAKS